MESVDAAARWMIAGAGYDRGLGHFSQRPSPAIDMDLHEQY